MNKRQQNETNLVQSVYPCMPFPMVEFYKRCKNPCIYCGLNTVRAPEEKIIAKGLEDTIETINKDYLGVYISPTSDAFALHIKETTYKLLEGILPYGKIPLINTKQKIPKKALELISQYPYLPIVQISIPTLDESLRTEYEPGSATIKERLENLKQLNENGIRNIALIMPWLGDIENSYQLLSTIKETGTKKCIVSLGIFTEETKGKMQKSRSLLLQKYNPQFNTSNKLLIGQGLTISKEDRIKKYNQLIELGKEIGIKVEICKTALNPDLSQNETQICNKFRHPKLRE